MVPMWWRSVQDGKDTWRAVKKTDTMEGLGMQCKDTVELFFNPRTFEENYGFTDTSDS